MIPNDGKTGTAHGETAITHGVRVLIALVLSASSCYAATGAGASRPQAPATPVKKAETKVLPPAQNSSRPSQARHLSIAELIEQAGSTKIGVRLNALKSLEKLGPAAAPAVPAIINALNDNRSCEFGSLSNRVSPVVTDQVLATLKAIGPQARSASPYLVTLLTDRNELFRRGKVLDTLVSTGLDDSATKTIIYVAQSEGKQTPTRVSAIKLLGIIDPPAAEAADMLRDVIDDKSDKASRDEALKAITSITKRMADRDAAVQSGQQPTQNEEISKLRAAVDTTNPLDTRLDAVQKIGGLGNKAAILVPYLIQIINDPNTNHKLSLETMKACGYIGPDAAAALPALISKLMGEKDELDRGSICRAIAALDPVGKRTIPLIAPALDDPFHARISIELLDELGAGESTNLAQRTRAHWRIK